MRVKELAEVLKVQVDELMQLLANVGVNLSDSENSIVDSGTEKKLAKKYNVPYPFKSAKPKAVKPAPKVEAKPAPKAEIKPTPKVEAKPAAKPAPKAEVKPMEKKKAEPVKAVRPKQENKPVEKQKVQPVEKKKVEAKPVEPKQEKPVQKVEAPKPVEKKPVYEEIIKPRVDEELLNKYSEFLEDDEYNIRRESKGGKKRDNKQEETRTKDSKKKNNKNKNKVVKKESRTSNIPVENSGEENILYYENTMTTTEIAEALHISVTELVKKLFMSMGIMATATQVIDRDTAELIAMEYDFELKDKQITDMTRFDEIDIVDDESELVSRPAIVTIMGHVDHGKTTLLDTIRSSHVVKGEAGGITQHIGAYQVKVKDELITFIDTPGHAAFTEMRARGAQITDIVILVVAADDGVMPQTREAIEHAQAAGVPIIVAINKMDRPGANPERIKQELTEYNLIAEEWGGDTIFVPISALSGKGVSDLLEMVVLVSEMKGYKANPNRLAVGTVVEAKLDKGRGPVATLLVQNGTIRVGDIIVVGNTYGKIRSMTDEYKANVKAAGPSKPVEITGINDVPFAGEKFMVLNDEKKAREISEARTLNKFNEEKGVGKTVSLNDLFKNQTDEDVKNLNLIIKCDVQGSIEAIKGLLEKIEIEGTKINVIASRVGGVNETDINLAIASNAIIIGFNIRPTAQITDLAKDKGIEIRLYNIIYKLQEDIEAAVKGMLDPVYEERISGQAEVREVYKISKVGTVAGSYVTSGSIVRSGGVRLIRDSIVIYTGKLAGLKRFKDDAKEVKSGYECGITIENYNDIKVGDIIECFVMEETERE